VARLIPSFVDDHTPPGERVIFGLLANGPDDWVALHSLDLAPWNRNLRTEVDFVVIVPDRGILCIEVKSHTRISYDGERWSPPEIRRSPFKQAADGRFTFYRRLRDIAPQFAHVPVVHCCIFSHATFELHQNMSVPSHEFMDARDLHALDTSTAFCANLAERVECSVREDANLSSLSSPLTPAGVESLVSACVPVQKRRPGVRDEIRQREEAIEATLHVQQRPILSLTELNDRVCVSGGAGTGKTLIAMEAARRAAEKGDRVALLCFNRLVGAWMREELAERGELAPNLVVGRAIQVLATMAQVPIPETPSPSFWETQLPLLIEDRLTDPDFGSTASFDYMVLDEAQDILARPRLWECLGQFLRGGTERGSYLLLGDFDHQVLAGRDDMRESLNSLARSSRPARWHLSENCRNYRIVGETALRLGGISTAVYSDYLRPGGSSHNYDIAFYESVDEQLAQLRLWLSEFKALGYHASEITILSFRQDEYCAAKHLRESGYRLQPAWRNDVGVGFASVHAFKGMENKIVILTDVSLSGDDFHRDVFYTGMTRATECLRVLCDRSSEATLCDWLRGKAEA
jgi:hypothetical protein